MRYSPILRAVVAFLRPQVSSRYYSFDQLHIPEKRLMVRVKEHLIIGTYTIPTGIPNQVQTVTHFTVNISDPDSLDIIKDQVIKFKHPVY